MPSIIDSLTSLMSSIINAILSFFTSIFALFEGVISGILNLFSGAINAVGTTISGLAKTFGGLVNFVLSNIVIIGLAAAGFYLYQNYQAKNRGATTGKKIN